MNFVPKRRINELETPLPSLCWRLGRVPCFCGLGALQQHFFSGFSETNLNTSLKYTKSLHESVQKIAYKPQNLTLLFPAQVSCRIPTTRPSQSHSPSRMEHTRTEQTPFTRRPRSTTSTHAACMWSGPGPRLSP